MKKNEIYTCIQCNKKFKINEFNKRKIWRYKKTGRFYCSEKCTKEFCSKLASEFMKKTNARFKEYYKKRMKEDNPSFNQEVINKVHETKKKNGSLHKPPIKQGGNGKEKPLPVLMLNKVLNWELNHIVLTGVREYYPTHYKLELANIEYKIAIEIDGPSAYSRKELSKKKETYLNSLGWTVIRFKNQEVLKNLEGCLKKIDEYLEVK